MLAPLVVTTIASLALAMFLPSVALTAAAFVVLVWAWGTYRAPRSHRTSAPGSVLVVAFTLPQVILLGALLGAPDQASRFRFSLLGVGFRADSSGTPTVSIGGSRTGHDVWISAFSEREGAEPGPALGYLKVRFSGDAATPPVVCLTPGIADATGLLAVRSGKNLRPLRSVRLEDGDEIVTNSMKWRVHTGSLARMPSLLSGGETITLPQRYGEITGPRFRVPIFRAYRLTERVYQLAALRRAPQATDATTPATPWQGLLFLEPRLFRSNDVWIALPASGVHVVRGETEIHPDPVCVGSGTTVAAMSLPVWDEDSLVAPGLVDRRSARVMIGDSTLTWLFDTKETHSLSRSQLKELQIDRTPGAPPRVHLTTGEWQITDRSLHFGHVGGRTSAEVLALLELSDSLWLRRSAAMNVNTPRGVVRVTTGKPFWLGERRLALVQFDAIKPPVVLAAIGVLLGLFRAMAGLRIGLTIGSAAFLATLDLLLVFRVLIAYRAWLAPPYRTEIWPLAVVTWIAVPWLFLTACLPQIGRIRNGLADFLPWVATLGGWLLSVSVALRLSGGGARAVAWLLLHAIALAIPLTPVVVSHARDRVGHMSGARRLLVERAATWLRNATTRARASLASHPVFWWTIGAVLFTVTRAALLAFGIRESYTGAGRVALSLVHIPGAIALEGSYLVWLWHSISEGRVRGQHLWPALPIVVFVWVVPAMLVSDIGLMLLNVPVFAVAVLLLLYRGRSRFHGLHANRKNWRLSLPLGLVALGAVFGVLGVAASPLLEGAVGVMSTFGGRESLESDRNYLRVLGFISTDELRAVGRRKSDELGIMHAVMDRYALAGVSGRGYFQTEVSPHVRATAFREHVPSAFVVSEWGHFGILAMTICFVVLALLTMNAMPWESPSWNSGLPHERSGTVAALASLTLATASLYMLAASYGLTLFTGKNVYFYGLDSLGDALESALLTIVTAAGLSRARE
jgi:hypothetical protein